jgi:hypothetical protein
MSRRGCPGCECCTYYAHGGGPGLVPVCFGDSVVTLAAARLALAGPRNNSCAIEYTYDAGFQSDLLAWVTAGGRVFLTADNITCFDLVYSTNSTDFNNLLGYLGSALQLTTNFPFGCPETSDCAEASPAAVGIMDGLPAPIEYKQGGEISGGTPLAYTSTIYTPNGCDVPHVLMAAEQIGDGLVVACASGYVFSECNQTGLCEFLRRLCKWSIADILEAI